eukprot:2975794-Prymnesium_polylepis.2
MPPFWISRSRRAASRIDAARSTSPLVASNACLLSAAEKPKSIRTAVRGEEGVRQGVFCYAGRTR